MDHIPRSSEAVYVGLCHKIGSPTEVRIRREVMDTLEIVRKSFNALHKFEGMRSGSKREGFRLSTSDEDLMYWYPDHKVICNISQINLYRIPQHTVILMKCDNLPLGFTRLNLMSQSKSLEIISSCTVMNNNALISSSLFRDNHMYLLKTLNAPISNTVSHGPCSTFSVYQHADMDNAFCFQSDHWSTSALPWIQRCCERGWPDQKVVSDISNEGFHVVPIGSTPENKLE